MGAITSAVSDLTGAVSAVKTVAGLVENPGSLNPFNTSSDLLQKQQDLAMKQLQAKQATQEADLAAQSNIEKRELATEADAASSARTNTLRRAVAAQRASAAADGVAPDDGSSAAVQAGLFGDADAAQSDADRLTALKTASIDQAVADTSNVNLLARTQLAQQQKLQRLAESY